MEVELHVTSLPNPNLPEPMLGTPAASPFDRLMLLDIHGEECWSARDLHEPMGLSLIHI